MLGRTTSKPEGPWSDEFSIYSAKEFFFVYSPSQQYKYDSTGKTLVVSYTGYPNILQAIKIVSSWNYTRSRHPLSNPLLDIWIMTNSHFTFSLLSRENQFENEWRKMTGKHAQKARGKIFLYLRDVSRTIL